ncbi:hypothetical protein NG895_04295 [Aeoliella sp. ICT_H6.2]|uniref:Uncharacterized protein n=1 Tax=Aeoliella straminimaris TaxID=2954799 RepID=A0A9X2F7P6_9BACT|nr:hypothetical protein [Aeoliella straminimaris]MCO6043117.1 hypothetical protein [Aeoliella straminimaris]
MRGLLVQQIRVYSATIALVAVVAFPQIGCNKAPELTPADKEKLHQEHQDAMRSELGKG